MVNAREAIFDKEARDCESAEVLQAVRPMFDVFRMRPVLAINGFSDVGIRQGLP
jgi:hypothetical protein